MPQLHAVIHGQVQGVSFRAYAAGEARRLGLTGWVCNQADGTVQTKAVGPRLQLETFVAWLRRGSPASAVSHVEFTIDAAELETFAYFEVRS